MSNVKITITTREGTIAYLGLRPDGSANWKTLKHNGEGTLPLPKRFQRQAKREQQHDQA